MELTFHEDKENGFLGLTDFSCANTNTAVNEQDYYRIIWIQKGMLEVVVDGIPMRLRSNQIIFLTPHNKLQSNLRPEGVVVFAFNREFYCIRDHDKEVSCYGYLFYGSAEVPVIDLDESEQKSFELLRQVFLEEFQNRDHIQQEMLQMLLKRLIIKSTRLANRNLANPRLSQTNLDIIRRFNILVEMHFRKKHKVADYADLLFKSPKTLSNLFAEYNNRTPLQVINNRILLEARRLLLFSGKTTKEIAFELGYDSASHFSKFFKKGTGLSPLDFKKSKNS